MFDRFTDKAKRAMNKARVAAQDFNCPHIGPEHILIGILSVGPCRAAQILEAKGIEPDSLLADLRSRLKSGEPAPFGQLPFTPRSKRVLEEAMVAAKNANQDWIGTEHFLAGLVWSADSVLAELFRAHALTVDLNCAEIAGGNSLADEDESRSEATEGELRRAMKLAKELGDDETARRLEALIARLPYIRRRAD